MTKKDFQLIVAVLANASAMNTRERSFRDALAVDFANALSGTNPLFKRELFIQAATGQVSVTARKARKPSVEDPDRDNTTFYNVDECPKCGGDRLQGDCDCDARTLTTDRAEDR